MCELKGNATTVVKKKKAYMKPVTSKVELPKHIAIDCSYDDVIKSSTGNLASGWRPVDSTLYIVIGANESTHNPGSHYSYTFDKSKLYRFKEGYTGGSWIECSSSNSNYNGNCEYNLSSGSITDILQVWNDETKEWDDVKTGFTQFNA